MFLNVKLRNPLMRHISEMAPCPGLNKFLFLLFFLSFLYFSFLFIYKTTERRLISHFGTVRRWRCSFPAPWPTDHTQQLVLTTCTTASLQKLLVPHLVENFMHFIEPEVSLPYSQQLAKDSYHDTENTVHGPPFYFLKINFNNISHPCLGLPSTLFPSGFFPPTQTPHKFLSWQF